LYMMGLLHVGGEFRAWPAGGADGGMTPIDAGTGGANEANSRDAGFEAAQPEDAHSPTATVSGACGCSQSTGPAILALVWGLQAVLRRRIGR
jgi:hypothetical protein